MANSVRRDARRNERPSRPLKLSRAILCRWIASRSAPPCRHPVPRGQGWIAGGAALAGCADRWTCPCRSLPGLPVANRPLGGFGRAVFSPPAPAFQSASLREKTIERLPDGSGTRGSEAPGLRSTGRLKPVPSTRVTGPAHLPSCASALAPVTGQEPVGTGVPGAAQRRRSHRGRGEAAWRATTSP